MKIGLYGGAFSPPHNGHVHVLCAFRDKYSLDDTIVMPSASTPAKNEYFAPAECRFDMARLAFEGDGVTVSHLELDRGGFSYTADTLDELMKIYGPSLDNGKIYFLVGGDMFMSLGKWHRAADIFRMAVIVYASRGGEDDAELDEKRDEYTREYGADCRRLDVDTVDISSHDVREAIRGGGDISLIVPRAVDEYIKERGLYAG